LQRPPPVCEGRRVSTPSGTDAPHDRGLKAYSNQLRGAAATAREARELYRLHAADIRSNVAGVLGSLRDVERRVEDEYGFAIAGRRVLDIGAGQRLIHMVYFARANRAVGIDLEVIARGIEPLQYVRMLRANGVRRTGKTIARKLLRLDARYMDEVKRQLGLARIPSFDVLRMDAADLSFPDASFDFVFSYSVFHHIPDPGRAIDEAVRVAAPRGVVYISFHLYSSDTGSLDLRVMRGDPAIPLWPHLRPGVGVPVDQNAYLNRLRLPEWEQLFSARMPGCRFIHRNTERARLEPEARRLRGRGELAGYELEELLTREVIVMWRKPAD
jgi:SAM-dependent methyltransferase